MVVMDGFGLGDLNRQSTETILGGENTLHGTAIMDACHYKFVQTPRVNCKIKYGFIGCDNYSIWCEMLIMDKAMLMCH